MGLAPAKVKCQLCGVLTEDVDFHTAVINGKNVFGHRACIDKALETVQLTEGESVPEVKKTNILFEG